MTLLSTASILYGIVRCVHGVYPSRVFQRVKVHMGYATSMPTGFCSNTESFAVARVGPVDQLYMQPIKSFSRPLSRYANNEGILREILLDYFLEKGFVY